MPGEEKPHLRLEVAHVLFVDIVGYSKLLLDEQGEALHELNDIVRGTEAVRQAEAAGQLIQLPTGDGMALVFTSTVEAPVECALQISQALRAQPSLPLRMGIHSGPVQHVEDVNGRANVAGSGINVAQRVMDCGDAGHILVSKRVADDLATSRHWQPYLHELGEAEVKHGLVVSMVNLYADALGNPAPPAKFGGARAGRRKLAPASDVPFPHARPWLLGGGSLVFAAILAFALWRWTVAGNRGIPAVAAASVLPGAPPAPKQSVAVLPFENLSADKDNIYFTDGVQNEILADLARVANLKVIARSSVAQYKSDAPRNLPEIAAQLGVANVLEGSVQRAGNQVRVTANLINARTATQLWAEHYDRPLNDVFAIQSEIAEAIAGQLQARLSPAEKIAIDAAPTADLEAYDLYLRAQKLDRSLQRTDYFRVVPEGVRLLEETVKRDPKFLSAWTLLGRFQGDLYWAGGASTPVQLDRFRNAVLSAVRLQPDAGKTHLALAEFYYHGYRDYDRALAELDLASRSLPNNADIYAYRGYIKRRLGRSAEGMRDLEQALDLDPRNLQLIQQVALGYATDRRYAEASKKFGRMLDIVPDDPATRLDLASLEIAANADMKPYEMTMAALLAGNPRFFHDQDDLFYSVCERDPATAERYLANMPPEGSVVFDTVWPRAYREALVARMEGDEHRARIAFTAARLGVEKTVAAQPDLAVASSLLGLIDAGLDRKQEALVEGRRACELLPLSKDAYTGAFIADNMAQILAWTGDKTAAIEQLAGVLAESEFNSYGQLKLNPAWDNLRGDPRFEMLVTSLAPKTDR